MIAPNPIAAVLEHVSLLDLIGGKVELRKYGRVHVGRCPFHQEKSPSFTVYSDHYHCFGCTAHGDAIDFVIRADGVDFRTAFERLRSGGGVMGDNLTENDLRRERRRAAGQAEARRRQERAIEIWRNGQPIEGTPAAVYLRSRGIDSSRLLADPPGWPETLRWSADASTETDGRPRPALVVAVNDARTGLVRGLQRIFLHHDGRPVLARGGKKLKLSLGRIEGNAARFSSWPNIESRWGIAEGCETALAATQLFRIPVWSAISSGNMPNVTPPHWCQHVTIFADHDDSGLIAAADARARYLETSGIASVKIVAAERMKADMADLVKGAA